MVSWFSLRHQPATEQELGIILANIYEALILCFVLQVLYMNDLIWPPLFSSREMSLKEVKWLAG